MRPFRYSNIILVLLLIGLDMAYLAGIVEWWWLLIVFMVYVLLLFLGAINIQWNFYLRSFNSGNKSKQIAITFDDGPGKETVAILDILKHQQVPAAFFTIGNRAAAQPGILRRWDDEGHVVGNHSYDHGFNFDWQSAKKMAAEIEKTNELVTSVIGKTPMLFRPPYGITNPNLAKAVKRVGMHSIGWSVRSFDTKTKDPQKLLNKLLNEITDGDIVLLHDSMSITREILTKFIEGAKEKGFTFARVDKLLDLDAYR